MNKFARIVIRDIINVNLVMDRNNLEDLSAYAAHKIAQNSDIMISGYVTAIRGLLIECRGLSQILVVGSLCKIIKRNGESLLTEVTGANDSVVLLMPFGALEGVGIGCTVIFESAQQYVYPSHRWKGRIINALGEAIDDHGPLAHGNIPYNLKNKPISAHKRAPVRNKLDLGVKTMNAFLSLCKGQRMGIFAGSGVGKSVLISMLGKFAKADVKVVGLIGERGRELYEFIHEYLGEEGIKQCVIIVATGDEPPVVRRQAAYLTLAVAEYFRDQGQDVLCIIDSLTRFAMAQREIGLSCGEPPTTKGYTPSVFSELPQLLERAGPGIIGGGSITGLFSVLVEGDDHNEPVADAVRGILDGHVVMEREIAERGIFPAINVLKSISRTMPGCNSEIENKIISKAKSVLSIYSDMAELIRLGAYKAGTSPEVDEAIKYYPFIEDFLKQQPKEQFNLESSYTNLANIFKLEYS